MINDALEDRKYKCMKVVKNDPKVSHLMFADDLIHFGKATENQIRCVMDISNTFCASSGQRINLENPTLCYLETLQSILEVKIPKFQDLSKL